MLKMSLVESPNTNAMQMVLSKDQQALLQKTYGKDLSTEEFGLFLQIAHSTGLNPFLKEIVPQKFKNKDGTSSLTFITTRDGYLKIAQTQYSPEYEGLISFAVHENDQFEVDAANYNVKHIFGFKDNQGRICGRGKIIGAWARCDRKNRKPQICFVNFDEYNTGKNTWLQYPSAMIQKVAEAFVLKRQFVINGLVTREEMGLQEVVEPILPQQESKVPTQPPVKEEVKQLPPSQPQSTLTLKDPVKQEILAPVETKKVITADAIEQTIQKPETPPMSLPKVGIRHKKNTACPSEKVIIKVPQKPTTPPAPSNPIAKIMNDQGVPQDKPKDNTMKKAMFDADLKILSENSGQNVERLKESIAREMILSDKQIDEHTALIQVAKKFGFNITPPK